MSSSKHKYSGQSAVNNSKCGIQHWSVTKSSGELHESETFVLKLKQRESQPGWTHKIICFRDDKYIFSVVP